MAIKLSPCSDADLAWSTTETCIRSIEFSDKRAYTIQNMTFINFNKLERYSDNPLLQHTVRLPTTGWLASGTYTGRALDTRRTNSNVVIRDSARVDMSSTLRRAFSRVFCVFASTIFPLLLLANYSVRSPLHLFASKSGHALCPIFKRSRARSAGGFVRLTSTPGFEESISPGKLPHDGDMAVLVHVKH